MADVKLLAALYRDWAAVPTSAEREGLWHEMLKIHAEQQFRDRRGSAACRSPWSRATS